MTCNITVQGRLLLSLQLPGPFPSTVLPACVSIGNAPSSRCPSLALHMKVPAQAECALCLLASCRTEAEAFKLAQGRARKRETSCLLHASIKQLCCPCGHIKHSPGSSHKKKVEIALVAKLKIVLIHAVKMLS